MKTQKQSLLAVMICACLISLQLYANDGSESGNLAISKLAAADGGVDGSSDVGLGLRDLVISKLAASDGGIDGGGGLVVACKNAKGQKDYQVLDLYQAKADFGLNIDLTEGSTYQEKITAVLKHFAQVAPVRAQLYRFWVNDLLQNQIDWRRNTQIPQSFDEGKASVLLPKGDCALEQVAYQRNDEQRMYPGQEKLVIIDLDIFEKLTEENKAALILHEVIYLEARIYWNHKNSKYARYLNALVLAKSLKTSAQYEQTLNRMNEGVKPVFKAQNLRMIGKEYLYSSGVGCIAEGEGFTKTCIYVREMPEVFECKTGSTTYRINRFKQYMQNTQFSLYKSALSFQRDVYSDDGKLKLNFEFKNFNQSDLEVYYGDQKVALSVAGGVQAYFFDQLMTAQGDCKMMFRLQVGSSYASQRNTSATFAGLQVTNFSNMFIPLAFIAGDRYDVTSGAPAQLSVLGKVYKFNVLQAKGGDFKMQMPHLVGQDKNYLLRSAPGSNVPVLQPLD